MWILIVRWSWTVADEGGMFGQRSWCIFDETFIDSEGKRCLYQVYQKKRQEWERRISDSEAYAN